MPKKPTPLIEKVALVAVVCVAAAAIGIVAVQLRTPGPGPMQKTSPPAVEGTARIRKPVAPQPVIDYSRLEKDEALKHLMAERKEHYGLDTGLDMIARSDESIKVGDTTVPMQEVVDQIRLEIGAIIEKDLSDNGGRAVRDFGVYVVHPGDNIWNVHFKFLQDYFAQRGVAISPTADEPDDRGLSSGVGKLLKFSENIVYIYNIRDKRLEMDLDMIHPHSKVVIYNMDPIFSLLNEINLQAVERISFDGENLWISPES